MKNIYRILSLAAFALLGVACETDDTETTPQPVVPDFTITLQDGTEFANADDALNVIPTGSVLTFVDKSDGAPQSIKWSLTSGDITKEVVAKDGKGSCAMIIAGKYDITMTAGGSQLKYINYLSVEGAGTPTPEEVILDYDLTFNGAVVEYDAATPITTMTGASVTLQDKSGGNPSTMTWTFTCEAAGVNDVITVKDIPYGDHAAPQSYTFPKGGKYTITQSAGGKTDAKADFFDVTENMLYTVGYDPSFENVPTNGDWGAVWNFPMNVENSTAQAYSGTKSSKFSVPATGVTICSFRDPSAALIPIPLENATVYEFGFWAYVESNGEDFAQIDFNLDGNNSPFGTSAKVVFDQTFPLNEWQYCTTTIETTSAVKANQLIIRLVNANNKTAPFVVYIDDLTMTKPYVAPPVPVDKTLAFTATDVDGATLVNESGKLNEVAMGSKVKFQSTATGEPTNVKWTLKSVPPGMTFELTPSASGSAEFMFAYEGTYAITMTADDADAVSYTEYIKVIDKDYVPVVKPDPVIPDGDLLSAAGYDYSFENVPTSGEWFPLWGVYAMQTCENSSEQSNSGKKSTKFTLPESGTMATGFRTAPGTAGAQINLTLEDATTYRFGFWLYVDTVGAAGANIDFNFEGNNAPFGNEGVGVYNIDSTFPVGTWKYCTVDLPTTSANLVKEIVIRGSNTLNADSEFIFYLDDLSMVKVVE